MTIEVFTGNYTAKNFAGYYRPIYPAKAYINCCSYDFFYALNQEQSDYVPLFFYKLGFT